MPQLASSVAELAAASGVRTCLEWFRRERNWINEQHLRLCRIPAPTFFEQQRAEWFANEFRALGWDATIDRAGNVVAARPGCENLPYVAVTAHLDTVFAPRTADDIRVSNDGRFLGPGVSDNGAGLAALLAIAAAWNANPRVSSEIDSWMEPDIEDGEFNQPSAAPVLIANVGEEGEGNLSGMRYICRAPDPRKMRGFLILDGPGTDHITSRALASRRFEVTVSGPGGHSWRDSGVGNPVHAVSRAISSFLDEARALDLPRTAFNFGIIEGGVSINSIPTEARTKIDLRSENPESINALGALLLTAVERVTDEESGRNPAGRLVARIKEIGSRPSGALADDASILEIVRAVDAFLGIRSHLDCSSTDANIPLSLGLQAVTIGAGGRGGGAHTVAEWYSPEGREAGLRRVFLSLCLLLGSATDNG